MLPNTILNKRGMSKVLVTLEGDGFSLIKEVGTVTTRENVMIGGCLIDLNRLPFL